MSRKNILVLLVGREGGDMDRTMHLIQGRLFSLSFSLASCEISTSWMALFWRPVREYAITDVRV